MMAQMFEVCKQRDIRMSGPTIISLYANPGYCSDWYLIYRDPFSVVHTTFTYKPITVSDEAGHTLSIYKKEPGGNVLELRLTGFSPMAKLRMTSCSAGEKISSVIEVGENGSYNSILTPQVIGFAKGVDYLAISSDDISLQASCEWDLATVDIKRLQPHSDMWTAIQSCSQFKTQQ